MEIKVLKLKSIRSLRVNEQYTFLRAFNLRIVHFLPTDVFAFVQTINFDGGFAFSISLSNLPGTKGSFQLIC